MSLHDLFGLVFKQDFSVLISELIFLFVEILTYQENSTVQVSFSCRSC